MLLEPDTVYDVRVRARTGLASGPWSDTVRAPTRPLQGTNSVSVELDLNGVTKVKQGDTLPLRLRVTGMANLHAGAFPTVFAGHPQIHNVEFRVLGGIAEWYEYEDGGGGCGGGAFYGGGLTIGDDGEVYHDFGSLMIPDNKSAVGPMYIRLGSGCGAEPRGDVMIDTTTRLCVEIEDSDGNVPTGRECPSTDGSAGHAVQRITARFNDVPRSHDGESEFTVRLAFVEDVGISPTSLREDALAATGGAVTQVQRVDDRSDLFEITVEPDSDEDVTITLSSSGDCGEAGSICTQEEDPRKLYNSPTATVAGPILTASFQGLPSQHDGETAFSFRIAFSDEIATDEEEFRDHSVEVWGGEVTRAEPVGQRRDLWEVEVEPASDDSVMVSLKPTWSCAATGAVCTAGGRLLSVIPATMVPGPATWPVQVTGVAQVGKVLTADSSNLSERYGVQVTSMTYRWLANGARVPGANARTYKPDDGKQGKKISVMATYTDDRGNEDTVTSGPTEPLAARDRIRRATGLPLISGRALVGHTLTADKSLIIDANGLENAVFYYFWEADGDSIPGATGTTYTPVAADVGKVITVIVAYVDDSGRGQSMTSPATLPVMTEEAAAAVEFRTSIRAAANADGSLTLYWNAPDEDVTGYRILRHRHSLGEHDPLVYVADTGSAATSFTDTGVVAGVPHSYRVQAIRNAALGEQTIRIRIFPVRKATNSPATGAPAISGTAQVGETLTADLSGIADEDGLENVTKNYLWAAIGSSGKIGAKYAYQWLVDGADSGSGQNHAGYNNTTYTLTEDDVGKAMSVRVTFVDDAGYQETLTSAATDAVAAAPQPNSPARGAPTIGGTAQVGDTLTADTSGITDKDGLDDSTFTVQWMTDDSVMVANAARSYTPTGGDRGKSVKVRVSFTDDAGNPETRTSAQTATVEARSNSSATGLPAISGTAQVGETLTANTSGIADADGKANASFDYQWLADDSDIAGATGSTYTPVDGDEGKAIKVRVSYTDDAGNNETLTSEATDAVAARPNSPATGLPTITGTVVRWQVLTADTSGIQDANGLENVAFRYQWFEKRAGATYSDRIDGETSASYRLGTSEVGSTIWVRVHFTDDAGNEESLTSYPTAPVASDHGDTPATATELLEGSNSYSFYSMEVAGILPSREDQDWFRLNITQAQSGYKEIAITSRIFVPLDEHTNTRIALYDSSISCLLGDCETDNGRMRSTYVYLEPGIYYLRVTGPSGNSPTDSDYEPVRYSVTVADRPLVWYDECAEIETGFVDPLYGCQTHLFNQDHPGEHINVEPVWEQGILGEGINVAVVDTGVDYTHEDLGGVIDLAHSTVYPPDTGGYYSLTESHGTAMASIIGGQHNSRGIRGIAPMSRIYSYHIPMGLSADLNEYKAKSLNLNAPDVAVSSNSWGFKNGGLAGPGERHITAEPIVDGITRGFHGKGTVYVFSASYPYFGPSESTDYIVNSNEKETQNFYAVMAVCGVGTDGKVVGHEWGHKHNSGGYGANLWVCAPWDALAADDSNGYATASGTSPSTAIVSGVAALVRSANPELTWRDVKLILAASARQNDTGHEDWVTGAVHYGGGPDRYHFNPNFGFGVVDAAAAVALAKPWVNLPPMTEAHRSTPVDYNREIPENIHDHVNLEPLQVSFGILDDGRTTPQFVEHVEINVDLDHKSVGNLDIWLTSPSGTVSRLAWPDRSLYPIKRDHSFGSSRHLGENPVGLWTLSVIDRGSHWQGQLKGASITIRGHRNVESPGDNSKPTGEPTVSGTAQVGQSLNVDTSTISDEDGLTDAVFQYQWISSDQTADTEIRGATEAAYTMDEEDVGKAIWVRVTFTDDAGNEETLTSTQSAPVAARPNTPATGLPAISGTAQVAETLTASISDIVDADGLTGATFSYQWVSSDGITDTDIREATSATYTLVVDDIGKTITVRVNYTDAHGFDETLASAPTAVVEASPNIPATGLPSITGAAEVGETLTVSTSGIQDANGLTGATFSYQWVSNDGTADMDIQEVTSTSHTLVADDIGKTIKVRVSFTDDGGNEETLTSAPTAAVEAKLNIPATGLPTISGKAQVGETLTADTSGIADHNGLENANFSYQWLADDTAIDGATGREYTLAEADKGKAVKVRVSFTDDGGNEETLTSAPTAPVFGDGPPGAPGKLTATVGNKEVTLSWEPPTDNGNPPVKSYRIEWRVDGKDYEKNHWGTSRSTTYTTNDQANLANGVKYFFRVKAGNGDGNRKGPYGPASEEVSATPTSGSAVDLGTPVLSNTENLHHRMMRLDWQDIEDAGWYVVQYYHIDGGGGEWLDLPAVGVDIAFHGSSAVVTNLDYGIHWLRVGAASCAGSSEWSQIEELYGTRASDWKGVPVPEVEEGDEIEPCPVVLGTPVLSEPEDLHYRMVQLDWQDIEDAGWYVVQYYHLEGGEWLDLPAEGVDIAFHGSSAVVTNLDYGIHWLRVGAASCAGESEWSQIEELYGTKESDWKGVPVPEVEEGDEIAPCSEDADTSDNSPATGAPTISGTAQVGEALEADTSGVTDADGLSNVQYEYQWLADDTDISGATNATYTLTDSEENKAIKVEVSFTDDAGNEESLTSAATAAVAAKPNSPATGTPTISGTAQVGETLTANTSGITDADGLSNVQYEYQWLADDSEISGATNATYTLTDSEESKAITVQVSFTDDADNEETLTSGATDTVEAAPNTNSPATGAPTISGTAQVGETLTANTSGVADVDGLSNVQYEYQWLADDADIAGATGSTYTLTDSEESKAITVQVSFTDDADNEETLTSAATAAVAGAQPTEPPAKPTGLDATATHDSVTLTWDDPGDDTITGYVILRRIPGVDPEGHFDVLVADTGSAATTYTDNTVAAETRYTYRIKAINGVGTSERSRWSHIDTPAAPVPDKPTGLEATESHGQVVLTWDDPGDDTITGYVILRRVRENDTGGDFSVLVADTGTAALTYTDATVAAGLTYTYRIKAINEHGTSERSRWYHIDIPAAP